MDKRFIVVNGTMVKTGKSEEIGLDGVIRYVPVYAKASLWFVQDTLDDSYAARGTKQFCADSAKMHNNNLARK